MNTLVNSLDPILKMNHPTKVILKSDDKTSIGFTI